MAASRRISEGICEGCGEEFSRPVPTGPIPKRLYCSQSCRTRIHDGWRPRHEGACSECGASLAGYYRSALTCSANCAYNRTERLRRERGSNVYSHTCSLCGGRWSSRRAAAALTSSRCPACRN